jgi:hypothetical protein
MTLLAAYQFKGVPLLMGDFVITGSEEGHIRKKIHLISPNLTVGWSGYRIAAQVVMRELHSRFNGQRVSKDALEAFLKNYPPEELGSIDFYLAGWVVDEKPHCFLWNSGYPGELFYEPEHVIGSGGNYYNTLLGGGFSNVTPSSSGSNEAIYHALCRASMLISAEVFSSPDKGDDFGFAYEVLYFDGNQFKYVDNILFLTWDVYWDDRKKIGRYKPFAHLLKYRNFESYSVVQIRDPQDNSSSIHTISPIHDDMPELLVSVPIPGLDMYAGESFSYESDYYCLFLRLTASDGLGFSGPLVFTRQSKVLTVETGTKQKPGIRKAGERERISFSTRFIQNLHSSIKGANDPRRAVGYNIYRSADPNLPKSLWTKLNDELILTPEFTDKAENREPGVDYYYYVTAVNGFGIESVPSDVIGTKADANVSTPFLGGKGEP